jgi:hypothetical protein
MAGRAGRTESKIARALVQGLASSLSGRRPCPRSCAAVHSTDAAACNRIVLACASHACRSLGPRPSCSDWSTSRLALAHRSKSENRTTGNIPNTPGSLPRASLQLGPGFLLRLWPSRLSTRLAQRSVGHRPEQERAVWHCACVVAWDFWNAPNSEAAVLRRLQGRRCGQSGRRLWKNAEVDHRIPLFRVWKEYRDVPWPKLLAYWGMPNLQVINRDVHVTKCAIEARDRRAASSLEGPD